MPPQHDEIVPVDIVSEMRSSYLDYAMSVIVSRALPDVRDGLKPVHRRILFAMHQMGLTYGSKFRKSAAVVGEVLGNYHPHGDSSVYDAMIKMAQDFYMRYPLVWGQGNLGSVDGDSAAAMRYTEAKMSRIADELLRDIEKETVDYTANYDNTKKEPVVFPSTVPNLLLNGTMGIAVGMATKIPPHNLREVMDATVYLAENSEASNEDLMKFVKGPDFPTGGLVFGEKDLRHVYGTGRGGVVTRGDAEIVENKAGAFQIVISSIPYQVNKSEFLMRIADHVKEKRLEGIKDVRDESTSDIRVVIDLKQGVNPQNVLNFLYKHTDLELTFNYNMVALVEGVPRVLSLKTILEEFLKHRQIVVKRRAQYDLRKAEERAHILEGLKIALDHIDEIIKSIKASPDTEAAHAALMKKFKLSQIQATAILEMKLQKLAGLERKKIEDELKEKLLLIDDLRDLLSKPKRILQIVIAESKEISEKYGDDRKSKIVRHGATQISAEDLVEAKESILVLTSGGYVKRTDPAEYRAQRRGGVGVVDLNTKEEDFITIFLTANTHNDLLFFTDKGKAYQIKMWELPEGKRATRGKSIVNYLSLQSDERVTSVLDFPKELKNSNKSLLMVTKQGVVKKVAADSLADVRRSGIIAIKLDAGDELFAARFVDKTDDVLLATAQGQSIRFKESDVREMGRAAMGVTGMKLGKNDSVVGADIVKKDVRAHFLVMSQNGFGKKTPVGQYKAQKRAGSGIKTAKVTPKTGPIIVGKVVTEAESELVAISKNAQVIRTALDEIPSLGRQTQGVRIMKLHAGDSIASLTCL